jgi:hypothetical protein
VQHSWLEIDHTRNGKPATLILDLFSCSKSKTFQYDFVDENVGPMYNPRTHINYKVSKRNLNRAVKMIAGTC